jgi:hypothetical protein
MALKTYDAAEVSVIVGSRPLKGFAEGSFVSVERDEDSWTKHVGADGEVTRAKSNNLSGTITITLMQASEDNAFLAGLAQADEIAKTGVVPVLIRDASGSSLHTAEEAWISKPATAEYGKEAGEREWVIHCAELITAPAGN